MDVIPHLPVGWKDIDGLVHPALADVLDDVVACHNITDYVVWYYTPMATGWSDRLTPLVTVYDCMDELSAFASAPPAVREREQELFRRADLVFAGGQSLYESKRTRHPSVHCFPSSVDVSHFAEARVPQNDPPDQAGIRGPRIGFFGVIDERLDLDLLAGMADSRPDWQLVIVGPVADFKFDPGLLPQRENIHYLGGKSYTQLPAYLSGWDVAILPFAHNESTRFISPTKTPEYLAAGLPVVSTSIRDVVKPYGELGLVRIADTVPDFVGAVDEALHDDPTTRLLRQDAFLRDMSWDRTWSEMRELIDEVLINRLDTSETDALPRASAREQSHV